MRLLITAGPTREPIDPVRFLSNRSSGRMGYALADAALAAGHEVLLISGPVTLPPSPLRRPTHPRRNRPRNVRRRPHPPPRLPRKGCDLIIANDVSQPGIGFDSAENEVTLCLPGGATIPLPRQSKTSLAGELIQFISSSIQSPASSIQ